MSQYPALARSASQPTLVPPATRRCICTGLTAKNLSKVASAPTLPEIASLLIREGLWAQNAVIFLIPFLL
jgi:hypothetical protein